MEGMKRASGDCSCHRYTRNLARVQRVEVKTEPEEKHKMQRKS